MNQQIRHIILALGISLLSLGLFLFVLQPVYADPGILYVIPGGAGNKDCTNWGNACTLSDALKSFATAGDEIWVAQGVYTPGTTSNATFELAKGVALYGGFVGTETLRTQRDWQAHVTVLSGDIGGDDATTATGVVTNTTHISGTNSYHVLSATALTETAVLDGFTVTAGQANGASSPNDRGGGMYNYEHSSPTLANVTFSGNSANYYGGGMYNVDSSPMLNTVTFSHNSVTDGDSGGMYNDSSSPTLTATTFISNSANYGGGMYNDNSSNPTLNTVTFSRNSATYSDGGGMYNDNSSPTLTHTTFISNSANYSGGGMYNTSSSPTLANVTFSRNSATDGGGVYNYSSSPTLDTVTFSRNSANYYGGGMYNEDSSSPTLGNITFSRNSATDGGGMYNEDSSSPTLANVTFSGNSANYYGGGMFNTSSSPVLTNTILWGDSALTGTTIYNTAASTPTLAFSDIQNCGGSSGWAIACGADGGGNIDADPLFVNAADDNLRLSSGSPAIDAGTNAGCPAFDMDGIARPVGLACDMGAYERPYYVYLPLVLKN